MKHRTRIFLRIGYIEKQCGDEDADQEGQGYFPSDKAPQYEIHTPDEQSQTKGGPDASGLLTHKHAPQAVIQ